MKKRLFICGDSFCSSDPEYGVSWVDAFGQLHPSLEIVNLSMVGASNYLIYLQVKRAIELGGDYLIYNATSSIRHEFSVGHDHNKRDTIERYDNIVCPTHDRSMISTSWTTPVAHWNFNNGDEKLVRDFFKKFVDLQNIVEKNFIFIQHTLSLLSSSDYAWAWSKGGFEHNKFNSDNQWSFSGEDKQAKINLWDYYDDSVIRPYFHVSDRDIITKLCNEYSILLKL